MAITEAQVTAIWETVRSHLESSGHFEWVAGHELTNGPKTGLTAGMWAGPIPVAPTFSGLSQTAGVLTIMIRIYRPMPLGTPREVLDSMDPRIVSAGVDVINRLCRDFTLDDNCTAIDLRGITGRRLGAEPGYLEMDARVIQRIMTITVPIIIADAWDEVP